jgi:hypothetical protein
VTPPGESDSALAAEAITCKAAEVRVGDTFISFNGPRIVTRIGHVGRRVHIHWRDGKAELSEGAEVRALWGTQR